LPADRPNGIADTAGERERGGRGRVGDENHRATPLPAIEWDFWNGETRATVASA
jgi:hypothetical protein